MELQEISDRLEIDDVLMQYYRGVDRLDLDLVRSCFHPDAQCDYGPWFKGDLEHFLTYLGGPTSLGGFVRTVHFAGNTLIAVDGDTARSEVVVIAHHEPTAEHDWAGAFVVVWLRYVDRLERRDGRWRIADRKVAVEWVRRDTAGMWEDVPAEALGRRDRSDLVYAP
jgi:hypothetical protein